MFFGSIASSVVVIIRKLCFLEQIQSKTSLCVVFESCYTSLIFIIASATKNFEMHLLVLLLLFKYLVIHLKIFARWNCQNWRMHFYFTLKLCQSSVNYFRTYYWHSFNHFHSSSFHPTNCKIPAYLLYISNNIRAFIFGKFLKLNWSRTICFLTYYVSKLFFLIVVN